MSFAGAVKDDLARISPTGDCCRKAELTAFLRFCGSIQMGGRQNISLTLASEHPAAFRRVFSLIKELFNLETQVLTHRKASLNKNKVYTIRIPAQPGLGDLLKLLGINSPEGLFNLENEGAAVANDSLLLAKPCCVRSYLRGAFLGGGSINNPKGDYHLELACNDKQQAQLIKTIFGQMDIYPKIAPRKQMWIVYLKGSEAIAETLAVLGSHRSLLEFENIRIEKEIRNHVNRQVNCEYANLNKTLNSASAQVEDIKFIDAAKGLHKLPASLRQAAQARLANPEASLTELAQELGIGRSGVNHRLRRLREMAEDMRAGQGR